MGARMAMPERSPNDPPNLRVALEHAARGRRVFPCDPQNKRPSISKRDGGNGFKDATTDPTTIRDWWARYPTAIVGMPTGARTGVFVVDIDVKAGKVGEDTLAQIIEAFGPLPETIEAITASGGRHLYFKHPRDGREIPNKAGRLGQGRETWGREGFPDVPFQIAPNGQLVTPDVDIRGDGGYVILPGSVMLDGSSYGWEGSSDPDEGALLADAPDWLVSLVVVDAQPEGVTGAVGVTGEKIGEGRRNDWLYRLGCSMRAKGLGESAIVAALLAENAERCDPPCPEAEVRATAKSAASKPPGLSPEYARRKAERSERGTERAAPSGHPESGDAPPKGPSKPALRVVGGKDARPQVEIEAGALPQNTDDATRYLMDSGVDVFQHGSRLVRVGRWEAAETVVERPVGASVLIDLTPEWLVDTMTRHIRFVRYDKRSEKWIKADCPTKIAKTLMARAGEWPFYHLLGFCDSPTLDRAGRVVHTAGFDKLSGLYLSNPPKLAPIPAVIDTLERDEASKRLFALFDTFPFATPSDESAALALVLTALLRRVLPSAPIGCINASTPGTGKSLLADCISVLVTGRKASVTALGKDGEEFEKRLDSILLKGDAICVFDNVDRAVKSDVLCQVATQSHKSVRILAQSRIVESPTNVCLLMTGNNLTLLGDLARRSLVCTLEAGVERPELREFKRDAIEHVQRHRADAIRWALMISKAYLDAGCPPVDAAPYGSFEVWDRMVRRPLIWAGWPDPLGASEGMREEDDEFTGMTKFLTAWWEAFKGGAMVAADIHERLTARVPKASGEFGPQYPALYEAASELFGSPQKLEANELGRRLRKWKGRILNGLRLQQKDAKSNRGRLWFVETVTTASPSATGGG